MRKKLPIIFLFFMTVMLFAPIKTEAFNNQNFNILSDGILMLDPETNPDDIKDWMDEESNDACKGEKSLLGDPNDEDSVAWLLQHILNYIKVLGPILVVVLSSIDYLYIIIKSDDESMKKVNKKLIVRLILAAALFFIPVIVEAILDIFGMTSSTTCGLR